MISDAILVMGGLRNRGQALNCGDRPDRTQAVAGIRWQRSPSNGQITDTALWTLSPMALGAAGLVQRECYDKMLQASRVSDGLHQNSLTRKFPLPYPAILLRALLNAGVQSSRQRPAPACSLAPFCYIFVNASCRMRKYF